MSKLKRLLGALSLVALFIFSSCVDDEVAPEVAALRQAQVDLLNADVAYKTAETRWENARAEQTEIANAFSSASNAIELQSLQLALDGEMLDYELAVAEAEATLLAAEQELMAATMEFERFLATAGLQDAAAYLDQWNAVVFGGARDADGHLIFGGDGLLATQSMIVGLEQDIRFAELYLNADSTVTQAFLDAKLDEALAKAQAALAAAEADLPVQEAVLAALEADDRLTAIAELQAALIPLASDSVEAIAVVEAAEAALEALEDYQDGNIATVLAFQDLDVEDNFPDHRDTWRNSFARDSAARANIVVFEGEIVAWETYADSLQAIYDEFYPQFVEGYETILAQYEADTVETYNNLPSNDAGQDELYALEDAYATYMIEWGLFVAKANDSNNGELPGLAPTTGDTTALVAARTAYDGLNAAQMLNTPRDGSWNTTNGITTYPGADFNEATDLNTWLNPPTALKGARDGGIGTGNGIGGALADYITASGNDGTAQRLHDDAVARFEAVNAYYGNIVNEYRGLRDYIAEVKAGTEDTGEYTGSVPSAPLSITDLSGSDLDYITLFFEAIATQNTALLKNLSDLAKGKKDIEAIFEALFPYFCEYYGDKSSEAPADPSVAKSIADLAAEEKLADAAADDLEYSLTIIDQESIDAYLAAIAALDEDEDALDAYYQELVPARLAVDAAEAAQDAVTASQDAIRAQIDAIENACDEFVVNDGNYTECGPSILDQIEVVEAKIDKYEGTEGTTGSILYWTREVEEAGVAISKAEQGQLSAEDMVAEMQAELAALQTQETVLQALADELQALVLAALAG